MINFPDIWIVFAGLCLMLGALIADWLRPGFVLFSGVVFFMCSGGDQASQTGNLIALLEGITYGFGIWWFMYLYVWTILWAIVMLLGRQPRSSLFWAIIAAFFGLFFGLLCSFPYLVTGGIAMAFSWWITGIPFDISHCVFNFLIVLVLFRPLDRLFSYLKSKGALL